MTQKTEQKVLLWTGGISLGLAALFFLLTIVVDGLAGVWKVFFLFTLGLALQCAIRLLLTAKLPYDHNHLFVTTSGWFQKNALDKWIIQKDPVRKWADLSDYDLDAFLVVPGQRDRTVQHTCTLELMNLLAALFAYLPLFLVLPADQKGVALLVLLVPGVLFSAWAIYVVARARHYRFQVKAGRV